MSKLKNILSILISLIVLIALFLNFDFITDKLKLLFNATPELVILPGNDYTKDYEYKFVKQVDDYIPKNYDDLINIFYSSLNMGWDSFIFYCPVEYESCLDDVTKISLDEVLLSDINNFVHPYNSYTSIKTLYDSAGKVEIKITHLYSKEEIEYIEEYVDNLLKTVVKNDMNDEEKIKALHDYIINNTKYDSVRAETNTSKYDSTRMTGLIKEHYAICSGYADIMAVLLNRLNLPNFKVSSENHVWNVVKLNNKWLHLDLTWDDPVTSNGKDVLSHEYFLITDKKLNNIANGKEEHKYNKKVYLELAK